jgi:DNA-3-methyladenine glycosylase II
MSEKTIDLKAAARHFADTDPVMSQLLRDALNAPEPILIPTQKPVAQYFSSIVASIISQQISTKAADAVRGRVITHLGGTITPQAIMDADFDELKNCGLSNQKTKYIKYNAEVWPEMGVDAFRSMPDAAIIAELTKLYGIGRWTAEMFLIFSLARANVFSYGDLGLMQGLYQSYDYKPHYVRKIQTTVDTWSPHKTAASLALWFVKDNGPVLL